MVIARVALGDPFHAKEVHRESRRPPERYAGGLHDSIIANPGPIRGHPKRRQGHQELMIFNALQAYPAFVVQYRVGQPKQKPKKNKGR